MDFTSITSQLPITDPTWIFFLVLLIILFAPLVMGKLHIPHIVGMILAGMLIGKHGLNLLDFDDSFELFGKVGMYYIVFLAGLELDMDDFKKNQLKGITFGLLSFSIPMVIGTFTSLTILHYGVASSLLLASIYASNTLIAYPIISRYGLSREPSSSISIAATIITVLFALIILAVIGGTYKISDGSAWFWLWLLGKVVVLSFLIIFFMPRLCRWFFRRYNDAVMQFVFVLSMVFLGAALMQLVGMEGILGAFLAGLVLNRYIPHVSPLMTRLEFVGNALFIPYFLIGVGMIIDIRSMLVGGTALKVSVVMTVVAVIAKWIPAYLTQKIFKMKVVERRILFGMTNAHAAAALAAVLIGHDIVMENGERLLNDDVLNGTVVLILITCIVSSIVTDRAAKKIITESQSDDIQKEKKEHECYLIPVANPETIDGLVEMALTLRKTKETPIVALSVVDDSNASESKVRACQHNLERTAKAAAAADAAVKTVLRYDMNIAQGVIHTMKEHRATDVIIGLHRKTKMVDSFFGMFTESLLSQTHRQIMIAKLLMPVNTLRRIIVVAPEKAEYEVGFTKWVLQLCRMSEELGCRIHFYAMRNTLIQLQRFIQHRHIGREAEFSEMDDWEELMSLAGQVEHDHLFVVVSSRAGSISYQSSFDKLPSQISKYFSNNSQLIIYPDQYADPESILSFSNPIVQKATEYTLYDRVSKWISSLIRKSE